MRSVSTAFMRALSAGRSDYALKAVITLADSTTLTLENDQIWDGGFSVDDAVSNDNTFDVGAAIINQSKVVINNIYEDYDEYDFDGATVVLYAGFKDLDDGTTDMPKIGTYVVDETSYDGSIVTLTCLDNMSKFDRPYTFDQPGDQELVYPATLGEIVRNACHNCGVTLANSSQQFTRYNYEVDEKPDGESTTYRQVIAWAAQIACSYARCNADGQLEIKWYNTSAIDSSDDGLDGGTFDNGSPQYSSGDVADGGTFNPWDTGYVYDAGEFSTIRTVHYIGSDYSSKISTDNVVITGVKVRKKLKDDSSGNGYVEYTSGTEGYMVGIVDNDLIQGEHGQDIADALGTSLIGLSFRKADITHPSDPTMEAGDVAFFWDRKGRKYPIIISSTTFTAGNSQHTLSSAETPKKNSMQRFTAETQNYVELRKQMAAQKTAWQSAVEELTERIEESGGLYVYEEHLQGGGTRYWYHNRPGNLADSEIRMLFSDVGFTMTPDSGQTWYGMTVDGTMIAAIMNTIGINFDWGTGGTLTLGGANNVNGWLRILNSSGTQIGKWDKDGFSGTGTFAMIYAVDSSDTRRFRFGSYSLYVPRPIDYAQLNPSTWQNLSMVGLYLTRDNHTYGKLYFGTYSFDEDIPTDEGTTTVTTDLNYLYAKGALYLKADTRDVTQSKYFICLSGDGITLSGTRSYVRTGWDELGLQHDKEINFRAADFYFWTNTGNGAVVIDGRLIVHKTFTATGTKSRLVATEDYADRLLYCYETPSPLFGDVGEGTIAEDGLCYIQIDNILLETINTSQYQVFLQKYGSGDCWVKERKGTYFVVEGTPGLSFGWELKAKQSDFDQLRLEKHTETLDVSNAVDYATDAIEHIEEIRREREGSEE